MEVLLLPFFDDNQYQGLLRDKLAERGIEVRVEDGPRPLRLFAHRFRGVDVLHVHWLHPYFLFGSYHRLYRVPLSWLFCALAAVFFVMQVTLASRLGIRVIWTVHNICNHERRYERLDQWVGRRVASLANEVHVWDETTRELAVAAFGISPEKTRIIPHGNYLPLYGSLPTREEGRVGLRERTDLDPDTADPLYLYFGVIRPYKGVPDLLRAFAEQAPDDAALIVAGTPKHAGTEREIRALANNDDRVHLDLEYLPDVLLPTYFTSADFVVLPYRHVFNSGSVVLAMGFGRPLVVPALGSIPSVVPEGNVVYEDLREGFEQSVDLTPDQRDRVGRENRTTIERKHDWDGVLDRLLPAYEDHQAE